MIRIVRAAAEGCAPMSTVAPSVPTWPWISCRASGLSRCCRTARRTGRAPYAGSYPASAIQPIACLDARRCSPCSASRAPTLLTSSAAICAICARCKRLKSTIWSMRLTNSGAKALAISAFTCGRASSAGAPSGSAASCAAPRLDVSTSSVLRKSTRFPCESVSCPSSITCKRSVDTSRCAFSNSSKSTMAYGRRRTASVSCPPSSYPT
mmetsp:Transcript_11866/g.29373  ORF Transcript_11866/g.29373 Transcript_11866/m.29373 type:complete len:209 (+) Transcript_11866:438-1064(+)